MASSPLTSSQAQSLPLEDLRRREFLSFRSAMNHSVKMGVGIGTAAAALLDPTGLLFAVTCSGVAAEGSQLHIEKKCLDVLQAEVRRRGLEPFNPNLSDHIDTFAAAFFGQNVGQVLGPAMGDAASDQVSERLAKWEAERFHVESTGTGRCVPRASCIRGRMTSRLQCDSCRIFFDPRFDTYSHCCIDDFDVCAKCQTKWNYLECRSGHKLSKLGPQTRPPVPASIMGLFGLRCDICNTKISNSEFYSLV